MNHNLLSSFFLDSKPIFLSVSPGAFLLKGTALPSINASIHSVQPIRKRFHDGKLLCFSKDASSSKDGSSCSSCPHRPQCTPKLRLSLHTLDPDLPSPLFLELAFSSSQNLISYLQTLHDSGLPQDSPSSLSVLNRGRWGEVLFSLLKP